MGEDQGSGTFSLPSIVDRRRPRIAGSRTTDWREILRERLFVSACLIGLWTAGIEARLFYLQVVQHADMMSRASRQQLRTIAAPAKRGEILDRNSHMLAYSVDADSIVADPTEIDDADGVAAAVCGALEHCNRDERQSMEKSLRRKGQFAYLVRKVSPDEEHRVRELKLKGVFFVKESRRYYPNRELGAQVVGYVGLDNVGLSGLESTYDAQIRGREGRVLLQTDAHQQALASRVERQATAGASLELTIDQFLQHIAERELQAGVEENRAAGGSAIIMDPFTGEILALANWPTFNPNAFTRASDEARRNRATQDLYEPGSTFKVVTASAALEEHVIDPDDPVDCSPGRISFGSRVVRDVHSYGVLPFTDVIVKSSNVGAIKVGLRLGPERLSRYVGRFGFGQTLSPDFRGESPGIVWNASRLDQSALASVSMGYQVGVTPLQMAAAVSSVANGGTLFEPHVVRAFIKDGRRDEVQPKALRRTISERTAAELTAIMEGVVERGTGKEAQIDGYTIAGKTGTAQKLVDGRYSKADYNASFVGFVPSRAPVLTIIVVIDSPHAKGYFGGTVAAPVFRRIAEASLRQLGVGPTINPEPRVLVARNEADAPILAQPVSVAVLPLNAVDSLQPDVMPDLRGLSARAALRITTRLGIRARMTGVGFVVEQSPSPGTTLGAGGACALKLGRRPVAAESPQ